jgi:bacillithiol synthase
MSITKIPYQNTGFYSKLIVDYLNQDENLKPFYNRFPSINEFAGQIKEKSSNYNSNHRELLVDVLKGQYLKVNTSEETFQNIEHLSSDKTFTITTGHQLNLFTGPLYFLYKIVSTINLCEELREKHSDCNFVPMYWMATEDHDFDEINFFKFKGQKISWNSSQTGGVGRFSTDGLHQVFEQFSSLLGESNNANDLRELFEKAYVNHSNLADATRFLANELFKDYGLVIIDADDPKLKTSLIPHITNELVHNRAANAVRETNDALASYSIQVNPRDINLFYLNEGIRERIVLEHGNYAVLNTDISFTKEQILEEVQKHPERFSPNVLIRPLYQEVVLPNLCYIGGGGELAYWLQLKAYFEQSEVTFPMLLLRNSVQVVSTKQRSRLKKLNMSLEELFLKQTELLDKKVKENSDLELNFSDKITFLQNQFDALRNVAGQTDPSFIGAVNAQEKKQINGLRNLEKRLLKAEKRRLQELVSRITKLQNELLPNGGLEERQRNFSEYYLEYGPDFLQRIKNGLKPLEGAFTILEF